MSIYLLTFSNRFSNKEAHRGLIFLLLGPFIRFKSYLQHLEKLPGKKPAWSRHIPKRSWRRHSAYLTCLHDMQQGK